MDIKLIEVAMTAISAGVTIPFTGWLKDKFFKWDVPIRAFVVTIALNFAIVYGLSQAFGVMLTTEQLITLSGAAQIVSQLGHATVKTKRKLKNNGSVPV